MWKDLSRCFMKCINTYLMSINSKMSSLKLSFASKYLGGIFLLFSVLVCFFPKSTTISGEYPKQEADPNLDICVKNTVVSKNNISVGVPCYFLT